MKTTSRHSRIGCLALLGFSGYLLFWATTAQAAFTLHIASYRDQPAAERRAAELRSEMPDVFVYGTEIPGKGRWYRICTGRFDTQAEAAGEILRLRSRGFKGYLGLVKLPEDISTPATQPAPPTKTAAVLEAAPTRVTEPPGPKPPAFEKKTRTLHLVWDANPEPDLAGYRIYYDTKPGPPYKPDPDDLAEEGPPPISVQAEDSQIVLHGLSAGKTYYLAIKALNRSGAESPFSQEVVAELN